jgi:hypothetical protein
MVEHIDGCIAFASSVDKAFADLLKAEWAAVLRQNGFPSTERWSSVGQTSRAIGGPLV